MWLLYLDESGNREEHDNFVLAGVAVFEGQVYNVSKQLENLTYKYFPTEEVELHVRELRNKAWSDKDPFTKKDFFSLLDDVAGLIQNAHQFGLVLFGTVIHIPSIDPDASPLLLAYEETCSAFNEFLHQKHARGDTQKGLVILDYSSQKDSIRELANVCRTEGNRWGQVFINLPEAPLFIESDASFLVQLADYIAHSLFRRYQWHDSRDLDKIIRRFLRNDVGVISGLRHIISKNQSCMCSSCISRE